MKPKINEKSKPKSEDSPEDCDFVGISWGASLGKEVQSFWESFDEEFE